MSLLEVMVLVSLTHCNWCKKELGSQHVSGSHYWTIRITTAIVENMNAVSETFVDKKQ